MRHVGVGAARWGGFGTLLSVCHVDTGLARWIVLYTTKILVLRIALIFVSVRHVGVSSARWGRFGTILSYQQHDGFSR